MAVAGDDITIAGWNISSDMASWLWGAARAFIKNSILLIKRLELDSCFLIVWGFCSGFITRRHTWKIENSTLCSRCCTTGTANLQINTKHFTHILKALSIQTSPNHDHLFRLNAYRWTLSLLLCHNNR